MHTLLQAYFQGLSDYVRLFYEPSKLLIDPAGGTLTILGPGGPVTTGLYTPDAFREVSRQWVRIGWSLKHHCNFTWMGRPVVQLPEDLLRLQEAVFIVRPDLIIETGIFQGGSLLYLATLCRAVGNGRVIGIDVEIPAPVRSALTSHFLAPHITLIEGSSTSPEVFDQVTKLIRPGAKVMVILDSDHSRAHVRAELELYAPLVTPGSYIIVEDGIMRDLFNLPGGAAGWLYDNPASAAQDFLAAHQEFRLHQPEVIAHSGAGSSATSYWPDGWLQRR